MGLCAQKIHFGFLFGTILCVKELAVYEMFSNININKIWLCLNIKLADDTFLCKKMFVYNFDRSVKPKCNNKKGMSKPLREGLGRFGQLKLSEHLPNFYKMASQTIMSPV